MKLGSLGLSHKSAPIEIREKVAKAIHPIAPLVDAVLGPTSIDEMCVVSTCNRVEFYVAGSDSGDALLAGLRDVLSNHFGVPPDELDRHSVARADADGLRHLFRVASALDSMVLGEPQILGQVKEAYARARSLGHVKGPLDRAFQCAFLVAKRVRTETGLSKNAVSMGYAAVKLAREIFSSLEEKRVLLVGAGKMAMLSARHLRQQGVRELRVANRSLERASELAKEVDGHASSLDDLELLLRVADIVITSTAAGGYVVDKPLMARVLRQRRYQPILFVDLAVPRNVDPKVATLENVFVYDVDDLETVVADNKDARSREAALAERIVEEEVLAFLRWHKTQGVAPILRALQQKGHRIAEAEAERVLSAMRASLPPGDSKLERSVRTMAQAIINKLLHLPFTHMRDEGRDVAADAEVLKRLFELELGRDDSTNEANNADEASNVVPIARENKGS